jgi:hypothetical protein
MDGPTRSALIKFALLTGAADSSTVGITCTAKDGTAIAVGDQLIAVINIAVTTNLPTNDTVASSIIAGKVKCPTSTDDKVAVWWMACTSNANQQASPMIEGDLVAGAGANTAIAVSGIMEKDALISCIEIAVTTGALTDRTDTTTITDDGEIKCSAATDSDQLMVMWHAKDQVTAEASMYLRFTLGTMGVSDGADITITGIKTDDEILVCYATDETSAEGLDEVAAEVEITDDDTIRIDQASPTITGGCKLWCFWVDRELVS